ncbi:hypothetical protein [Tenacibaculum sp. 190524A05c]|uniref:hypothetical protein n=1 Tax=Tenacibaculum platacis TaxID=3137852 RepID=UPI0032B1856C
MNKLLLLLLAILLFSCKTKESKPAFSEKVVSYNYEVSDQPKNRKNPYSVLFSLEKNSSDTYTIVTDVFLSQGAHFISPSSKEDFKGKFRIIIPENDNITVDKNLIETPKSHEEFDPHPFVAGFVNWVRVNTTYKQKMTLKTNKDFTVSGTVEFVVEPNCTLEKVPFTIKQEKGWLVMYDDGC